MGRSGKWGVGEIRVPGLGARRVRARGAATITVPKGARRSPSRWGCALQKIKVSQGGRRTPYVAIPACGGLVREFLGWERGVPQ